MSEIRSIQGRNALCIGEPQKPAPKHWQWVKLDEIARLESGHTPSRLHSEYWDGDIAWVGIKDARLSHGGTIKDTIQKVTQLGIANSSARLLPADTVCLSRTASVGYVVVLGREMSTSQDFVNWVCSPALDPRFLQYLFVAEGDDILRFGKGSTHTTIYFEAAEQFRVCIPAINEQRRIVAKLDDMLARSKRAKEELAAIPALLERYRQSVLAAAFRGDLTADWRAKTPEVEPASELLKRIRLERRRRWEEAELERLVAKGKAPTDEKWKGKYEEPSAYAAEGLMPLPMGWTWATWAMIGFSQNGRPFPSSDYQAEGIKLLRPGNLFSDGSVRWTPTNTKCMPESYEAQNRDFVVRSGELIMNLTAQSLKDEFLGRTCITAGDETSLLNQRLGRLTPVLVLPKYVLWLFKSQLVRSYIDNLNTGSLIQHMFTSQVNGFVLPIAPLAEQHAIVDTIERSISTAGQASLLASEQVDALDALDRTILTRAFRGELVPQDPNDEPASVLLDRIRAERASAPAKKPGRKPRSPNP
ncbi:MAG: restriction endonuclease subunit S [Rhodoglobus sp.]|nr:restriction endonuclease subunit S [Rhodoglobus sp.]